MTFVEKIESEGIVELTFRTEVDTRAMVPYSEFAIPGSSPDPAVEVLKQEVETYCKRNKIKLRTGVEYVKAVDHYSFIFHIFKIR